MDWWRFAGGDWPVGHSNDGSSAVEPRLVWSVPSPAPVCCWQGCAASAASPRPQAPVPVLRSPLHVGGRGELKAPTNPASDSSLASFPLGTTGPVVPRPGWRGRRRNSEFRPYETLRYNDYQMRIRMLHDLTVCRSCSGY